MKYRNLFKYLFVLTILFSSGQTISAQIIKEENNSQSISIKRNSGMQMLDDIKDIVKRYYFDPQFRGIDLNARFKAAKDDIKKAENNAQIFRVIAQVLLDFNDSHTRFYPPSRSTVVEYGFTMQTIGNDCFVTDVKKGSDAAVKGLKPGDRIIEIEGFAPNRGSLKLVEYVLYALEPRSGVFLTAQGLDGKEKKLEIKAKLKTLEDRKKEADKRREELAKTSFKCNELGADVVACKMYSFIIDKKDIDRMMAFVGQRKKLIFDLRGNGGGYLRSLAHLTGYFFDRDIKMGEQKLRDKNVQLVAKTHGEKVYKGELIVLVDSDSASAAEMFSGTIQMEKRGKVIGDVTSGAVMASYSIPMAAYRNAGGNDTYTLYGMSITIADFLLRDGKRLEGVGVVPDTLVGPAGDALLNKYDPVLAYAAMLFGVEMSQEKAGQLYFMSEKPEQSGEAAENKKEDDN